MKFIAICILAILPVSEAVGKSAPKKSGTQKASPEQIAHHPEDLSGKMFARPRPDGTKGESDKPRIGSGSQDRAEDSALLWIPRIFLWPFRAVFTIIAEPCLALVEWSEESGFAERAGGIIRSPEGHFFPSFAWIMHKRPTAGAHISLPDVFGESGVLSAQVMGGFNVWEAYARLSLTPFKNFRFALEGRGLDRDDYRIRVDPRWVGDNVADRPEMVGDWVQLAGYRRRYVETGASARAFLSKRAAIDLGVFYTRDDYGRVGDSSNREARVLPSTTRIEAFQAEETGMHGVDVRVGIVLGGRTPFQSWNDFYPALRRHPGPGGIIRLNYFHSFPDGIYRVVQGEIDVWWTLALPRRKGLLTAWASFRYLGDLGNLDVPPQLWIHLGGMDLHRGMREGFQAGTAAGLAGVEYTYPILPSFLGIVFLDWGSATDRNFENWRWSLDMTSIGGRVEWEIIKDWRVFIQAGFSKEDRIIGAGFGKGS